MDQSFSAPSPPDPRAEEREPDGAVPAARASSTAGWLGALARTARIDAHPQRIFPLVLDTVAAEHPGTPGLPRAARASHQIGSASCREGG